MDFEFEMEPESSRERPKEHQQEGPGWVAKPSFYDTSMSRSSGPDLLPKATPSAEALGFDLANAVFAEGLSEDQLRMVLWTIALQNAFERGGYAKETPGFRTATYGFFDPEAEMDGFGVIAYVAPSLHGPTRGEFQWVTVDDQSFSIIVRPAEWRLHAPTVHPALGTSTCWAESRRPRIKNKSAILTAKHVVGQTTIGSAVPMTSGHGTLLDLAPEGIDAALVQVNVPKSQRPEEVNKLTCQKFVAQWTDVDVYSPTGQFSTKVTEVSSGRGTLDPSIPLRIFLANPGQSGDSGALVMDNNGNGVGLYMGEVTTPTNVQEGFCQHLGQVEESMAVDLFL
ncbi:MAG TPA: hypothetical protein VHT28_12935 [Silvibacterium sp.]|jgi:hypothetical protein|nr:hypothetical protein [Silvibacterium sp.]